MNFTIAYCKANKHIAEEIASKLQLAACQFTFIEGEEHFLEPALPEQVKDTNQPVLLLISDNFVKSTGCMHMALFMLQANTKSRHIQSIIIDGEYQEEDGTIKHVPTLFDRVSNVIQYMNYWQERYLTMRKEKAEVDASEQDAYEQQLKIIRGVSSEVGEFLRVLRGTDFWTYDQFIHNEFELFFQNIGRSDLHQKHQKEIARFQYLPAEEESEVVASNGELANEMPYVPNSATKTEPLSPEELVEKVEPTTVVPIQVEAPVVETEQANDQNLSDRNPLLEKLMEYQQDRLAGKDMGDLSDENYNSDLDQIVLEVEEEEKQLIAPPEPPLTKEEDYAIIESLFHDDDEEEEEFPQAGTSDQAGIPIEVSETPDVPYHKINTEESIHAARRMIQSGEITWALNLLRTTIEQEPNNINLRFLYANCLIETSHEYDLASRELEHIITLDPNHVEAYQLMANLAEKKQDYLLAKNYYEKILTIDKKYPKVYSNLALVINNHFEDQRPTAAKYLKKAIKLDPQNPDVIYQYAIMLADHLGEKSKAIKYLEQTLALQKDHLFANYDLALIYHSLDKIKKARKYYKRAYKHNPELKTPENDKAFEIKDQSNDQSTLPGTGKIQEDLENRYIGFTGEEIVEEIIPDDFLKELNAEQDNVPISDKVQAKVHTPSEEEKKTILITGATSGIGSATAELFAQKGYRLILTGRRAERLDHLKANFKQKFNNAIQTLAFDVRDIDKVKASLEQLPNDWKNIDVLINNAGLAKGYAPIYEGKLSDWETMIDTNIKGLLYLTRAISPYMVQRKSGHIINLSSSAGKEVYPNGNVYCATKHAVEALTKAMRIELHQHNIRVSQVSPGHVEETEFAYVRYEDREKAKIYEDFQPLKAIDVAETIYFI
ncbi:MAG: SDR family NAD(P)-dependent oxidoreductase, partial [Bacteroidota bacterium]